MKVVRVDRLGNRHGKPLDFPGELWEQYINRVKGNTAFVPVYEQPIESDEPESYENVVWVNPEEVVPEFPDSDIKLEPKPKKNKHKTPLIE
jgi:hypothetical protein